MNPPPNPEPLNLDRLCIHQVTLMQCNYRDSIECLSRHGVFQTAIWREKLEETGLPLAAEILNDNGVRAVSLCAGGLISARSVSERQQALADNARWLEQAAAIGAESMVTITGGLDAGDTDIQAAQDRALEVLAQLVPLARSADIRLALEPLHPMVCGFRSVISTLAQANDILDKLDCDEVMGIALDSYALWWDPALQSEIRRAGSRIINFHVSDWLQETGDVRLDRGMPGDGQIDNRRIRSWLEGAGFDGSVEVEIFSQNNWWQRLPDDVVQTILSRAASHL